MAASVNKLTLTLVQQDSNGVNILNRLVGPFTYPGITGEFINGILPDTSAHGQTLPTPIVLQYYLKNTHVSANITVTWTYQGGSTQTILKLGPGDEISFWCTGTSATRGVTAISLQSDTSNTTFEEFMGG